MQYRSSHSGYSAVRVEGGILPSEFLEDVNALKAPEQSSADYGLSKSLMLKEEIGRYWRIACDLYDSLRVRHGISEHVVVDEWLEPLLRDVLGYQDLKKCAPATVGEREFKLTHRACGGSVPIVLAPMEFRLDKANQLFGTDGRRDSPHGVTQEFLNAEDACLWGMASNGKALRLLRDNPSLTRPSFLEADLETIFEEERYPEFRMLWLTVHASRLSPKTDRPSSCRFEMWREKAHETGERVRGKLRLGVTEALRQLGNGFLEHPANIDLREMLRDGRLTTYNYYEQLLRLVYRFLFLLAAEARSLLHDPNTLTAESQMYQEGYSIARLVERSRRNRHYDQQHDLWLGVLVAFKALRVGQPALGISGLGGLFAKKQCPALDTAHIRNSWLLSTIRALSFFDSNTGLTRINYRDMGTEELGSVYESLLELQPWLKTETMPWSFGFIGDGAKVKGSARKLSGSYYTPPTLVDEIIKSALVPVLEDTIRNNPADPRRALLKLKVVDPACGSGHFLLAAARRIAAEVVRVASPDDVSESYLQRTLRDVLGKCIYGIDRNPLAVELCKTALWMEALEPGKPLSYLDHHVKCGDSLLGLVDETITKRGIPSKAYDPKTGDAKSVCADLKKRNKKVANTNQLELGFENQGAFVAHESAGVNQMGDQSLDDVRRKEEADMRARRNPERQVANLRGNLFVGAFFAKKAQDSSLSVPTTAHLLRIARPGSGVESDQLIESAVSTNVTVLAKENRFFHWNTAFADIMYGGGFDVVLGNPPWEKIKLQEKEFFASRSEEIANAPNKAARAELIKKLGAPAASPADRQLLVAYEMAKSRAEKTSQFVRCGGRFPLTGKGDINTYALFAETFLQLLNERGRAGMLVPSGIATDDTTKDFFADIVTNKRLVSFYDFENRQKLFPAVDSRMKFSLMTLTGIKHPCEAPEFAFYLHRTEHLRDRERSFHMSEADFRLFNPNTLTCPIFRTRRDMEIVRKMYQRAGVLWREGRGKESDENPWGVRFSRMFDMANDSGVFRTRVQLEDDGWELKGNAFVFGDERYLPLYEAKLFHQYDHRFATYEGASESNPKNMNAQELAAVEKRDPNQVVLPRYWVPEQAIADKIGSKAEQSRAKQSKAEQSRAKQSKAEQSRANGYTALTRIVPCIHRRIGTALAIRNITRATDHRTIICTAIPLVGLSHSGTIVALGS